MTQVDVDDPRVVKFRGVGELICQALTTEATKLGFDKCELPLIAWADIIFTNKHDPLNGIECFEGQWMGANGYKVGQIQFNSDGSYFAEHDIVKQHPTDRRWFVEAVEAWGRSEKISTDVRLLSTI